MSEGERVEKREKKKKKGGVKLKRKKKVEVPKYDEKGKEGGN